MEDIITFTKKVRYPDFRHDIIDFFSHNAALYTSMKYNETNISIDAVRNNDGSITYIVEAENVADLESSLQYPITIFGETHIAITERTDKGLTVNFKTTAV